LTIERWVKSPPRKRTEVEMNARKRSVLSVNPNQRPHDLDQKYRKLAIPAVAAAVAVDKRKGKREAEKQEQPTRASGLTHERRR
jgi:hypothetical protein